MAEQLRTLLLQSYRQQTAARGRRMIEDNPTMRHIELVAKAMTEPWPRPGLLLRGMTGNGKTTLALALRAAMNILAEHGKMANPRIKFVSAKEVGELMLDDRAKFKEIRESKGLIIDDFGQDEGAELHYGRRVTPVADLISYRYDRQLFTILTSNVKRGDLSGHYDLRIIDRLDEMFTVVTFENESYRANRNDILD